MPIPFDNMSKGEGADVIGWFRFVEAQGSQSIHAGLFETSALGEPLGFSFVRGDLQGSAGECGLSSLAEFFSGRARRNRPCCSVWRKKYLPGRSTH